MSEPENKTAQNSGNQGAPPVTPTETLTDTATATAEAEQSANTSGQEDSFDPQAVSRRIDELTSKLESNDPEVRANATDELNGIQADLESRESGGELQPQQAKPTSSESQPQADTKPEDQGDGKEGDSGADETPKFFVTHKGKRIERDDKNKLLGFDNTGSLKAAYIKLDLQTQDQRERYANEVADLNRKLREAEERLSGRSHAAQPQPQPSSTLSPQGQQTQRTAQIRAPQKPVFPSPPKLSTDDPLDYTEEDKRAVSEYTRQNSEAQQQLAQYVDYLEKRPGQIPDEVQREITDLRRFRGQAQETLRRVEQNEASQAEQEAEKAHWQRFSDFQSQHKSFQTPKPLNDLHGSMLGWMRNLATANGLEPPAGERDDSKPEWRQYLNDRADIVEKFIAGDQQVVANADGFQVPEGHEQYFKLLEVSNALNRHINDGVLGEKATLEDAYDRMLRESGQLDQRIEDLRIEERTTGAQRMGEALDEFSQSATNIPPEASAPAPDDSQLGMPMADLNWFRTIGPVQYQSMADRAGRGNAQAKAELDKYNAIVAKLEAAR